MNVLSKGKLKAISQTFLDGAKILLAALVAADFIQFSVAIKLTIVFSMILLIILGVTIAPDES